jgi:RHS repeat-associated protein
MIAMRKVPPGGGSGTLSYLLADHLGGTTTVLDASGNVTASRKYWPYGAERSISGDQRATDLWYTGQRDENYDGLGLYNYKARMYSTMLGRFVSADPLTVDGLNRYAYVQNNPLRYNDPSGYCILFCQAGGIPQEVLDVADDSPTGSIPNTVVVPPICYECYEWADAVNAYLDAVARPRWVEGDCTARPTECPQSSTSNTPEPTRLPTPPLDYRSELPNSGGCSWGWFCGMDDAASAVKDNVLAPAGNTIADSAQTAAPYVARGLQITVNVLNPFGECQKLIFGTLVVGGATGAIFTATAFGVAASWEVPPVAILIGVEGVVATFAGVAATGAVGYAAYEVCTGRAEGGH